MSTFRTYLRRLGRGVLLWPCFVASYAMNTDMGNAEQTTISGSWMVSEPSSRLMCCLGSKARLVLDTRV